MYILAFLVSVCLCNLYTYCSGSTAMFIPTTTSSTPSSGRLTTPRTTINPSGTQTTRSTATQSSRNCLKSGQNRAHSHLNTFIVMWSTVSTVLLHLIHSIIGTPTNKHINVSVQWYTCLYLLGTYIVVVNGDTLFMLLYVHAHCILLYML